MEYQPEQDPGVQDLDNADSDDQRRTQEEDLLAESDNSLQPGDPEAENAES